MTIFGSVSKNMHTFAQVSCDKPNFTTVLKDMSSAGLARGVSQIQGGLDKKVEA